MDVIAEHLSRKQKRSALLQGVERTAEAETKAEIERTTAPNTIRWRASCLGTCKQVIKWRLNIRTYRYPKQCIVLRSQVLLAMQR